MLPMPRKREMIISLFLRILSIIYFTCNLTDSSRVHIISEANKEHLCYGVNKNKIK